MAEIIIEGHKIDTKDIWDVQYNSDSWRVDVTIKITGKPNIIIGRKVPWECSRMTMEGIVSPYKKLYESIKQKWEADKSDLPVFKL